MFDIGWSELLVIAVVAIVVIGPKDLPRAMRTVGHWTAKMKRMAREFQNQFNEAIREAELDGVKKDVEALAKINPSADVKRRAGKDERRDHAGSTSASAGPRHSARRRRRSSHRDRLPPPAARSLRRRARPRRPPRAVAVEAKP